MIITATSIQVVVPGVGEGRPASGPPEGEADFAILLASLATGRQDLTAESTPVGQGPVSAFDPVQDRAGSDNPGAIDQAPGPVAIPAQAAAQSPAPDPPDSDPGPAPAPVDTRPPDSPRRIAAIEADADGLTSRRQDPASAGSFDPTKSGEGSGRKREGTDAAVLTVSSVARVPSRPVASGSTYGQTGDPSGATPGDAQGAPRRSAGHGSFVDKEVPETGGRSSEDTAREPSSAPAASDRAPEVAGEGRDRARSPEPGDVASRAADTPRRDGQMHPVASGGNAPAMAHARPDPSDAAGRAVPAPSAKTQKATPDQTFPGSAQAIGGPPGTMTEFRRPADRLLVRPRPEPGPNDSPAPQMATAKAPSAVMTASATPAFEHANHLPEGTGPNSRDLPAARFVDDAADTRSRPEVPETRSASHPPAADASKATAMNSVSPGSAETAGDKAIGETPLPDVSAPSDTSPSTPRESTAAGSAPLPSRGDVARVVIDQLAQAIRAGGDGSVDIQLSPEELGRVRVTLSLQDGDLFVAISTDRVETLDLMRRHIDLLARDFREQGYTSVQFSFGQGGHDGAPNRKGRAPSGPDTRPSAHAAPSPPGTTARIERPARPPGTDRLDLRL